MFCYLRNAHFIHSTQNLFFICTQRHNVKVTFNTDTQRPARNPGNAQSNPNVTSTTSTTQSPEILNRFGADDDLDSMAAVPSAVVCFLFFYSIFFFFWFFSKSEFIKRNII